MTSSCASRPPSSKFAWECDTLITCAMVVVEARPVGTSSYGDATMIIAILGSIAAIAALCWLLFMLATYALPALGGVAAGMWAYQTGAGLPGSVLVGLVGAGPALQPRGDRAALAPPSQRADSSSILSWSVSVARS